ncbi:MAG: copper-translocating P-type ATPase, partial [Desulfocapsaceae bacterium]|nr:copper-translocating P-type ATPase [Desulfocapsaceae bacterium]
FYGGWPFLKGIYNELKDAKPGMMTLIGLAITVAYVYSGAVAFGLSGKVFFWELASLIDIMLLGHWLEMRSVMSAHGAMEELAKLMPKEAHRLNEDGSTEDVKTAELAQGNRIVVKPGEKVPADGRVTDGHSSVNEAMVTGEANPVEKQEDDEVIGGTINGEGALTVEVEKTGEDSYLSQVIDMVNKAQESKSKAQGLADRAAGLLFFLALGSGILTMTIWWLFTTRGFDFSLQRTVTVMIITCPHALGLAIPLVVAVSTALAAKNGFLIRNRTPFETARKINTVLFDKTGTLTTGEFGVSDVVSFAGMAEKKLLNLAAAVEAKSEHPIARAIGEAAESPKEADDFDSIPGKGAKASVDGREIMVVSRRYLEQENIAVDNDSVQELLDQGKTVVFVLDEGEPIGAVALDDQVREQSHEAVKALKNRGIKVMMITGDNEQVAARVSEALGLDEYFAEVQPEEKSDKVKQIQDRGHFVAMTGDGVNDAPALAQADVGVAIGAGTDVAVETADIVLVKSNPQDIVKMIQLSEQVHKKTIQNLFWATGYNAFAIPLAAGVLWWAGIILSPAMGAVLMSLSTIIVAVNAKLLKMPGEETA